MSVIIIRMLLQWQQKVKIFQENYKFLEYRIFDFS